MAATPTLKRLMALKADPEALKAAIDRKIAYLDAEYGAGKARASLQTRGDRGDTVLALAHLETLERDLMKKQVVDLSAKVDAEHGPGTAAAFLKHEQGERKEGDWQDACRLMNLEQLLAGDRIALETLADLQPKKQAAEAPKTTPPVPPAPTPAAQAAPAPVVPASPLPLPTVTPPDASQLTPANFLSISGRLAAAETALSVSRIETALARESAARYGAPPARNDSAARSAERGTLTMAELNALPAKQREEFFANGGKLQD